MHNVVFDDIMKKHWCKYNRNYEVKIAIRSMVHSLKIEGINAGRCINVKLQLYEIKRKRPPLRLYYQPIADEILLLACEMKTNKKKQQSLIDSLLKKIHQSKSSRVYFFFLIFSLASLLLLMSHSIFSLLI